MSDMMNKAIRNEKELEFAIFCVENIAIRLGMAAENIYDTLTIKSDILNSYIIPNFEVLHTQGKDYIIDDIIEIMKEKGVYV